MNGRKPHAAALAALCALAVPARAQFPYDVPYVPTPQVVVDEMLRVAKVGPQDFVIDLGSGDGRIPITAAKKFGARGLGVDLDGQLTSESEENARYAGVGDRVKFLNQDLFKTDISQATVITMYLLPQVNRRLRPRLLDLKPGTRIVAHDFDLDDWRPDAKTTIRKNVFLWIVPAKVGGRWQGRIALPGGERGFEFDFRQQFQEIDGLARIDGQMAQMWEAGLRGDRIRFVVVDSTDRDDEASLYFEGRIIGNTMEGSVRRGVGNEQTLIKWRAVRTGS
ncbi:MAG TPA: 50S ribosomal protein L11 methyltransferase [Burkholderiales bacterium]|nr:50S ribosomal protein L11 methyltransferase [Burkholderiales bacterium]